MRYFIELSYKGTNFHGWQRQPNAISVQQSLEESLAKLLNHVVQVTGCGRTDAGVHARKYIAHFETNNICVATDAHTFLYRLNCILPPDIAASDVYQTQLHARYDALEREYQYRISLEKNPFETDYSWTITNPLNLDLMNKCSQEMLDFNDFASMAKMGSDNKTTICKIYKADWEVSGKILTFTITADRFVRGMVRAITGTLVDVGKGKINSAQFIKILLAKDRALASMNAPAKGLCLTNIKYK